MEEARSAIPRAGRETPVWSRPGWRSLAIFVALAAFGLLVWLVGAPGMTGRLFGVAFPDLRPDGLSFFFVPVVCGSAALVAGFMFPENFYLWGIALNLHAPFVEGLTVYMMQQEGVQLVDGTPGIASYLLLSATLFVVTTLCYTALSTLGAAARYLSRRAVARR